MRNKRVSAIVIGEVSKPKFTSKQILSTQVSKPIPKQTVELMKWIADYYPSPGGVITAGFVPSNLSLVKSHQEPTKPVKEVNAIKKLPPMTRQQVEAYNKIIDSSSLTALLHGDTGTGKTRVYLEFAKQCLSNSKNVVVLTPEIGLTSQLADSFSQHLDVPVLVVHSGLTGQQRRDLWLQILYADSPLVILGPRSALFTPLNNVGLIIVDEAHDNSYKQDQLPRYHALRVAAKLSSLHNARLLLGTATPLISEYYFAKSKNIPIVRLTELAAGAKNPPVITVIDTKDRSNYTRNPNLSNALIDAIAKSLENGEQSLVFLNRRGTARLVICQSCDWHALCPNCNTPLTYHGDSHTVRCHTCGHNAAANNSCPVCKSPDIIFKSVGTKSIASSLQSLFPNASLQRFDTDNIKDEKFIKQYQSVRDGQVQILVGTQMLVKGLDLPNLGMVGVVAADSSLYFPDFTAEEQTYQLLTQVIGRVGRGHTDNSSIVIQTQNPKGRSLVSAINKDWDGFYASQLIDRKNHKFPPFYYVLKVYCSRKSEKNAIKSTEDLRNILISSELKIEVSNPAPRFNEHSNGEYNWQLIIRAKNRLMLVAATSLLPANWNYDIDPLNLL